MASIHDPINDIGPEFSRRLEREVMHFARQMHEIGRHADRFGRADLIQAECDRLAALSEEEAAHARR